MMNYILWLLFGALVGWVSAVLSDVKNKQDILMNMMLGVVGAFVGGFAINLFGLNGLSSFSFVSFLIALAGAALLIILGRKVIT